MSQTEMEKCCKCIVDIFHEYAKEEKPPDMLSKGEFAKLLKEQLPNVLQAGRETETIDGLFKELDQDNNVLLSVDEFLILISKLFE